MTCSGSIAASIDGSRWKMDPVGVTVNQLRRLRKLQSRSRCERPETLKTRLRLAARNGWLRSYLLRLGEQPLAFLLGLQFRDRFLYQDVGFDQEWRSHRAGSILQLLALQNLFETDTPRTFEFGVHGEHKAEFGNETYAAETVFLFRPTAYTRLASTTVRATVRASDAATTALGRLGLKRRLKQLLRRRSVS